MRKTANVNKLAYIPLIAGLLFSTPFTPLEARGDRGSRPLAANEGGHHQEQHGGGDHLNNEHHGDGYERGYEHGYNHGYNHGYEHGYGHYEGGVWVEPGVVVPAVGVGVGVGVYQEPQPVYYTPEPGVNIHIGN